MQAQRLSNLCSVGVKRPAPPPSAEQQASASGGGSASHSSSKMVKESVTVVANDGKAATGLKGKKQQRKEEEAAEKEIQKEINAKEYATWRAHTLAEFEKAKSVSAAVAAAAAAAVAASVSASSTATPPADKEAGATGEEFGDIAGSPGIAEAPPLDLSGDGKEHASSAPPVPAPAGGKQTSLFSFMRPKVSSTQQSAETREVEGKGSEATMAMPTVQDAHIDQIDPASLRDRMAVAAEMREREHQRDREASQAEL